MKNKSGWRIFMGNILRKIFWHFITVPFNPFVPNAAFLPPPLSFQGLEKGCIGNKWVKFNAFYYSGFLVFKVSIFRIFSSPFFPAFGLNTEFYRVVQKRENTSQKKLRIWTPFR